jgi:hypothetical protein
MVIWKGNTCQAEMYCRHGADPPKNPAGRTADTTSTYPVSSRCVSTGNGTCIIATTSSTLEPEVVMSRLNVVYTIRVLECSNERNIMIVLIFRIVIAIVA